MYKILDGDRDGVHIGQNMLLVDYIAPRYPGGLTLTALSRESKVSWKTVVKAASHALPVGYEIAEKLSAATSGKCSIDEIRHPRDHMTPARRAEFEAADRQRARDKVRRSRSKARAA